MQDPTFTTNLDAAELPVATIGEVSTAEQRKADKARADLYTALTGLVTVGLLVALAVAVPVVVAAYRWAF